MADPIVHGVVRMRNRRSYWSRPPPASTLAIRRSVSPGRNQNKIIPVLQKMTRKRAPYAHVLRSRINPEN
jgi:hypothetical protein